MVVAEDVLVFAGVVAVAEDVEILDSARVSVTSMMWPRDK